MSERAWGTVREDYSASGDAWGSFPHDHARSRAYRWNEDGLLGWSDRSGSLCFSMALWNGVDPILKERLYGLPGGVGNHGEDVKELYWYLDSTPTHSYCLGAYAYPHTNPFPYSKLEQESRARGFNDPEYELEDTGAFEGDLYHDVMIEYAKAGPKDTVIRIGVTNVAPEGSPEVPLHVLPTIWWRNVWSWGYPDGPQGNCPGEDWPIIRAGPEGSNSVIATHPALGKFSMTWSSDGVEGSMFTENTTNRARVYGEAPEATPAFVKDGFHRALVNGEAGAVRPGGPGGFGTKFTPKFKFSLGGGKSAEVFVRITAIAAEGDGEVPKELNVQECKDMIALRKKEADSFYSAVQKPNLSEEEFLVQRQAFAGLLWTKQLYYYDVPQWLDGDPIAHPPDSRLTGRNSQWRHLTNFDVISMPCKWEYPWYASWDLAFHCIPLTLIDPEFSKRQLTLVTREWYSHPSGAIPAYEWNFGDVNPPVTAWATWRVYFIAAKHDGGRRDRSWLLGMYNKLLLNFTWWVTKKDTSGRNVFEGGFLGLDNVSVFDRSAGGPVPGSYLDQSDGTAWMGSYSLTMMKIALELAREEPVYQDMATKFFEHFLRIAEAMTTRGGEVALWDEKDQFFYDALVLPGGERVPIKVRSIVGLLPLFSVEVLEENAAERWPVFSTRVKWFTTNRPYLSAGTSAVVMDGSGRERRIVSLVDRERLICILRRALDPKEFLSDYGLRSLSAAHNADTPYVLELPKYGKTFEVHYTPGESDNGMFGGNSNWRGPIWMPTNYLMVEALQKYHHYYGDRLKVECPTGSGVMMDLNEVSEFLSQRLARLFLPRVSRGVGRPAHGDENSRTNRDARMRQRVHFYEYFHGDTGKGLGSSHQTGWTALVAKLIHQSPVAGHVQNPTPPSRSGRPGSQLSVDSSGSG